MERTNAIYDKLIIAYGLEDLIDSSITPSYQLLLGSTRVNPAYS